MQQIRNHFLLWKTTFAIERGPARPQALRPTEHKCMRRNVSYGRCVKFLFRNSTHYHYAIVIIPLCYYSIVSITLPRGVEVLQFDLRLFYTQNIHSIFTYRPYSVCNKQIRVLDGFNHTYMTIPMSNVQKHKHYKIRVSKPN